MRGVSGQTGQNSELSMAATVANNTEKNGRIPAVFNYSSSARL